MQFDFGHQPSTPSVEIPKASVGATLTTALLRTGAIVIVGLKASPLLTAACMR
jgi:hypothetical protein